jgi:phosphopentomutase
MEMKKRAIVIVMDGCGAGAAPDAADFGDCDSPSTIKHIWEQLGSLEAPNLSKAGFFAACGISSKPGLVGFRVEYGRLQEISMGKDSVTGHWEMMGIHTHKAFPTYPQGFPQDLISKIETTIGHKLIGNKPSSGTVILNEYGEEHLRTGFPIIYTSADSVLQIACNESVYPITELYNICENIRKICIEPHNVARVIARPFIGSTTGHFQRTERRKDFPLVPPSNIIDSIGDVFGIGVIPELFGARGFRNVPRTQSNKGHAQMLFSAMESDARFIFANFEDFDMLYGHRNDVAGFGGCIEQFDSILGQIIEQLSENDILILTADHGNDPTSASTDHSREYVPFCILSNGSGESNIGDQLGFQHVGELVSKWISDVE